MANEPVEIVSPNGTRLTVQRSALPVYLRRGCEVVDGGPIAPPKSAPKLEWVTYAVSLGIDRDEAEATSKADLVEQLTA